MERLCAFVVLGESNQPLNSRVRKRTWVAMNRIAEPRFMVPERITVFDNPIQNQSWTSDLRVITNTTGRVLDNSLAADAHRHKIGIVKGQRLTRIGHGRRWFVVQRLPSAASSDLGCSLSLVSSDQTDINSKTAVTIKNDLHGRGSRNLV